MTTDEFNAMMESTFDEIRQLCATKGKDYTHDVDDRFDNFKRHATDLDLSPEQVWAVYAAKHWDAVMSYCKRGQVESEPIEGRIDDLLLYLLLLKGRVTELARLRRIMGEGSNAHDEMNVGWEPPTTHQLAGASFGPSGRVIPVRRVEHDETWQGNESIRDEFHEGSGDAA